MVALEGHGMEAPRAGSSDEAKGIDALQRALAAIPFYARRGARSPGSGSLAERVAALPLLLRRELRGSLPKAWVPAGTDLRAALASGALEAVETAGTTGERLRVLRRRGDAETQRAFALRLHPAAARTLGEATYREARLSRPVTGMRTCHAGPLAYEDRCAGATLLLSLRPDPMFWAEDDLNRMLDELARHGAGGPLGLEGDATHLAVLARHATAQKRRLDLAFVAFTQELATTPATRALAAATDAPTLRLLGSVEAGPLLVEQEDGTFAPAQEGLVLEVLRARVETPGAGKVGMLVASTLGRDVQPLLRYATCDLVAEDNGRITSLEGRFEDALLRRGGGLVTAGALDRALAGVEVRGYEVVQTTPELVEVNLWGASSGSAIAAAKAALAELLPGTTLEVRTASALAMEASGRFRSSKRRFPLDLAAAFDLPGELS